MRAPSVSRFGAAIVSLVTLFGVVFVGMGSASAAPLTWTLTNNPEMAFVPAHAASGPGLVRDNRAQVGVSCPAANVCLSVGDNGGDSTTFQWDHGVRWVKAPDSEISGALLRGISCVGTTAAGDPAFCMSVGSANSGADTQSEKFDGNSFSTPATPDAAGASANQLNGVACVSSTNCTAVGSSNRGTLIEHWNGSSWSVVASPNASGSSNDVLLGVSCSPTFCVAVGNSSRGGLFESSYSGGAWVVRTATAPALDAVSCANGSFCMVTGDVIQRWNGSTLTTLPTPAAPSGYHVDYPGVSCVGTNFCAADQRFAGPTPSAAHATEIQWNGTAWSVPSGAATSAGELAGMGCATATFCMAVGGGIVSSPGPTGVRGH